MGATHDSIDAAMSAWIAAQRVFFVGTAPLAAGGHVNVSPKGGSPLQVLGPRTVAYLDGAGSGIETVSHLRENGRIVIMLCAFEGPPRILRLHGRGVVVVPGDPDFDGLLAGFPPMPVVRSVIRVEVDRIADSCGYGVPIMPFVADREDSARYVARSTDQALKRYLQAENRDSLDGLAGLTESEIDSVRIRRT